jgi:hypothetical protein
MADLRLLEGEKYVRRCGSRLYQGGSSSPGYLFLTDKRLVFHKTDRILLILVAVVPAAAALLIFRSVYGLALSIAYDAGVIAYAVFKNRWNGRFAFDIPLKEISAVERVMKGRKKEIMVITKKDGGQCRISADRADFWQSEIRDAMSKDNVI